MVASAESLELTLGRLLESSCGKAGRGRSHVETLRASAWAELAGVAHRESLWPSAPLVSDDGNPLTSRCGCVRTPREKLLAEPTRPTEVCKMINSPIKLLSPQRHKGV